MCLNGCRSFCVGPDASKRDFAHSCDKRILPNPRSSFDPVIRIYYYIAENRLRRYSATPRRGDQQKKSLRHFCHGVSKRKSPFNDGGIYKGQGVWWRCYNLTETFVTLQCNFWMLSPSTEERTPESSATACVDHPPSRVHFVSACTKNLQIINTQGKQRQTDAGVALS